MQPGAGGFLCVCVLLALVFFLAPLNVATYLSLVCVPARPVAAWGYTFLVLPCPDDDAAWSLCSLNDF